MSQFFCGTLFIFHQALFAAQLSNDNVGTTMMTTTTRDQDLQVLLCGVNAYKTPEPVVAKGLLGHCVQHIALPDSGVNQALVLVKSQTTGHNHDGEIVQWGSARWYHNEHINRLVKTFATPLIEKPVVGLECDGPRYAAIDIDGALYTWGGGVNGALGHGNTELEHVALPKKVTALAGVEIKQVACGCFFMLAVAADGRLYAWGTCKKGVTGLGVANGIQPAPRLVEGSLLNQRITQVSCSIGFAAAVTACGDAYMWGNNLYGQLGQGHQEDLLVPALVNTQVALRGNTKMVSCGGGHTVALTQNGQLFTFGCNEYGELGHGDTIARSTPTLVNLIMEFDQISCGLGHSVALTSCGQVFSWGMGELGQLGHACRENVSSPRLVKGLQKYRVTKVTAASSTTIFYVDTQKRFSNFMPFPKELGWAVNNPEFADVSFSFPGDCAGASGCLVHAHRVILAQRCEYFARMFRSGMRETIKTAAEQEPIAIHNTRKHIFLLLLQFVYTDSIQVEINDAMELYALARLCGLRLLQEKCVESVEEGLTTDNVLQMLQVAVDCSYDSMKQCCLSFVSMHFGKVVKLEGFQRLRQEILLDIAHGVANRHF